MAISAVTNPFYTTAAWVKTRNYVMARDNHLCQWCLRDNRLASADLVHHIKHLYKFPELGLDTENLISLCEICHGKAHRRRWKNPSKTVKRRARIICSKANPIIK